MKFYFWFFNFCFLWILALSCKKIYRKDESLPLRQISVKTTLKNHTPGVDYTITGSLQVSAELSIEPGVEIAVESGGEVVVKDTAVIHAIGTANDPIKFTSKEKNGTWSGILFHCKNPSEFNHVEVKNAASRGWDRGCLEASGNAHLILENVIIEGGQATSAVLAELGALVEIKSGCNFHDNQAPFQQDLNSELRFTGSGTFISNTKNVIVLNSSGFGNFMITGKYVIRKKPIDYLVARNFYINDGELDIESGINLQFVQGAGIYCSHQNAKLLILGNAVQPVKMYNETGIWKAGEPSWAGIMVGYGYAKLRYVVIEDVSNPYVGAVTVQGRGVLDMTNCTMKNFIGKCSIMKLGNYAMVNSGIAGQNTYINSKGYCDQ
ncbi:MAG: hypothetical protein KG003_08220 [Bacteroidetes bacterium]|nr:hypothetical protein [Bacteroidota bacterium]